jgi:hypothetical protein
MSKAFEIGIYLKIEGDGIDKILTQEEFVELAGLLLDGETAYGLSDVEKHEILQTWHDMRGNRVIRDMLDGKEVSIREVVDD